MKNILNYILISSLMLLVVSCEKDEHRIYLENGTAPVLSANKASTIPLSYADRDKQAIRFSWTNPDYTFTTGVSSHNVTYQLEIDTVGADFKNPQKQTITVSSDLSLTLTQSTLNDYLLNQLVLQPGMPHNIEVRVQAFLDNSSALLSSNTLQFEVTPYSIPPKVDPPASGKLFITGSATPASWMCGCGEAELTSQQFTQVTPTLYVLDRITLTGGGSYLFIPNYGDWGAKYGGTGANNSNDVNGGDFKFNGGDLVAPATTGDYKIEVDFQRGKFTVTKL